MKVVSKADSAANGTCQKPEFATSFENILASDNCPRVYSTEGISCCSRRTLSFSFVKSTQILTSSFFGTTTMGAHQSVGSSTLTITPVHQWQSYPSWDVDSEGLGIILESNFVRTLHLAKAMEEIWVFCTIVDRALDRLHSADQMQFIYRWFSQ